MMKKRYLYIHHYSYCTIRIGYRVVLYPNTYPRCIRHHGGSSRVYKHVTGYPKGYVRSPQNQHSSPAMFVLTSDTAYAYIIRSGDPYMVGAIKSEQDVVVLDTVEQHFCNSTVLLMIDLSVGAVQV